MPTPIQSPLSYYLHVGEQLHKQNVRQALNEIASSVAIDRDGNAKTVAKYNHHRDHAEELSKTIRAKKRARNWGIGGIITLGFILIIIFSSLDVMDAIRSMLIVADIIATIVFVCFLCRTVKRKLTALQEELTSQQQLADNAYQEALVQMQDYNNAFPKNASLRLVEKTMPIIAFDNYFTAERLNHLQQYGLSGTIADDETILGTLSGELYGKPFLYDRRRTHRMEQKTYHGSLTIHWTTTSRDSRGNTITRHHSETLHASVDKPYPNYYDNTWLYYGADALPELCFSRSPKFSDDKSERQLERAIRKGERKLRKLEQKELREGGDFTQVENTEFEVLFDATNRSDELDFREMYTIQAQKNTLDLLLSDETYGDDFYYVKQGKLHQLKSAHRQYRSLYPTAKSFQSHDVVLAEQAFTQLNERFYKDVFFDFAPILAVPILQSVENSTAIFEGEKTHYNYEAYANALSKQLRPARCDTECIFKIYGINKDGDSLLLSVAAYGYYGIPRVDYVCKRGGDGDWHDVPIKWIEYIPISCENTVKISEQRDNADASSVADGVYATIL